MQLVEQGKLSLDDVQQVENIAPELRDAKVLEGDLKSGFRLVEKQKGITLRMLLNHTGTSLPIPALTSRSSLTCGWESRLRIPLQPPSTLLLLPTHRLRRIRRQHIRHSRSPIDQPTRHKIRLRGKHRLGRRPRRARHWPIPRRILSEIHLCAVSDQGYFFLPWAGYEAEIGLHAST